MNVIYINLKWVRRVTLRLKSDNDYFEMIGSDQDYVGPPGNVLTHVTLRNCCNNLFN